MVLVGGCYRGGPGHEFGASGIGGLDGGDDTRGSTGGSDPSPEMPRPDGGTGTSGGGGPADGSSTDGWEPMGDVAQPEPEPEREPAVPVADVAELMLPHDVNAGEEIFPGHSLTIYGKSPELIARPHGDGVVVLAQDYDAGLNGGATLLKLRPLADDYVVTAFTHPPILDRVMGMDHDRSDGGDQIFVATAVHDAWVTDTEPPAGVYRPGIVRVVSTDLEGDVAFDVDLDIARGDADPDAEQLIRPMRASTARLTYGGGVVALVHGGHTDPDFAGVRHQKSFGTHLDATTGSIIAVRTAFASHSFDQRMTWDGEHFVEMHLGDGNPRAVAMARLDDDGYTLPLFHIKGEHGNNITRTKKPGRRGWEECRRSPYA